MSRTYLRTASVVLLVLLATPSVAHASFWDFIWKLSGPQMTGVVLHCEYDLANNKTECRALDWLFAGELAPRSERRWWLSLDTAAYTSTGSNSGGHDYRAFENYMVAFEPMIEVRSYTTGNGTGNWSFNHGLAGLSYDVLAGKDFSAFDKLGLKFRPIGVTYKRFNASFTLRWYPHRFTAAELGAPDAKFEDPSREDEIVYGFSVGYLWKKK